MNVSAKEAQESLMELVEDAVIDYQVNMSVMSEEAWMHDYIRRRVGQDIDSRRAAEALYAFIRIHEELDASYGDDADLRTILMHHADRMMNQFGISYAWENLSAWNAQFYDTIRDYGVRITETNMLLLRKL